MSAAPKFTPKESARIEHWDDERSIGNSLIVTLRDGFKFYPMPYMPAHVEGFDTVKDARAAVRAAVPCACATCGAALAKVQS